VRSLLLALVALCWLPGCGGTRALFLEADPATRLGRLTIEAARAWTDAGVPTFAGPGGDVAVFWVSAADNSCESSEADGCAFLDRIEVVERDEPDSHFVCLLEHEIGHVRRGRRGHVRDDPDALMAEQIRTCHPTPRDVVFVLE